MHRPATIAAALLALAGLPSATASAASKVSLAGTHKCARAQYIHDVRVKGWNCAKARQEARYWETTGRGNCRKGLAFRNYKASNGTTYLSCGKGSSRVFWREVGGA